MLDNLTERENEVLELMIKGYTNIEIAKILFISVSTVKFYVSSIFQKLNVKNRVCAVTVGLKLIGK